MTDEALFEAIDGLGIRQSAGAIRVALLKQHWPFPAQRAR